jgi:hypothetical protein
VSVRSTAASSGMKLIDKILSAAGRSPLGPPTG